MNQLSGLPQKMYKPRTSRSISGRSALTEFAKVALVLAATFSFAAAHAENTSDADLVEEASNPYSNDALNYANDLPYGGLFYGNPNGGVHSANAAIAEVSSRRFRAERTGEVEAVRYQNRILKQSSIDSRCNSNTSSKSLWCACKQYGLDAKSCGYTLGSSYHVGNGGLITIEIRPDDGNGLPSDTVLGKSSPYVPFEKQHNAFLSVELLAPTHLESGRIYHLVYTNARPPIKCEISHVDPSKAGRCDRDRGAIGLNGVFYPHSSSTTGSKGPWHGSDSAANLYQRKAGDAWRVYGKNLSWFELAYVDGVNVGDSYDALNASKSASRKPIEGNHRVRQRFSVLDISRTVDGVWLNFGHSRRSNGSPLSVTLKNDHGSVLATGSIAASAKCMELSNGNSWDTHCRDWGYTEFNHATELLQGSTYTVEFSASNGAGFRASTVEPLSINHEFDDRNNWKSAYGEVSSNNGSSWHNWNDRMPKERDMSVLFTIQGMPRQMP